MWILDQPYWLFLFPLPLLLWWLLHRRTGNVRGASLYHPHAELIADLAAARGATVHGRTSLLPLSYLLASLLFLLALARPQWLDFEAPEARQGHELMVALDVSGSMRALDFSEAGETGAPTASRLGVVRSALDDFLAGRRHDRIGLVLFGDSAALYVPLTTDHQLLRELLAEVRPGMLGERTALGDAVALAVDRLRRRPEPSRLLILFSDGAHTAGDITPEEALDLARRHGVRIFTVAVGRAEKVLFPRGPVLAPEVTVLPPDTALLQRLARESGGHFYRAESASDMQRILDDLNARAPTVIRDPERAVRHQWFFLPVLAGLALLLAARYRLQWRTAP